MMNNGLIYIHPALRTGDLVVNNVITSVTSYSTDCEYVTHIVTISRSIFAVVYKINYNNLILIVEVYTDDDYI